MIDIRELVQMMKATDVTVAEVTRMAGLHHRYISRISNGEIRLTPQVAGRITLAISRLKRGDDAVDSPVASRAYAFAVAYVAMALNMDPAVIMASDPARRATADKIWLEAATARRWAIYIANQYLGIPQASLARAARMSKAAVSYAMGEIEDERGDPKLEQLLKAVETAFSFHFPEKANVRQR